jgi:hypothetical protein
VEEEDAEPEIDEQSDDEDERQAHAFLQVSRNEAAMVGAFHQPVCAVQGITSATFHQPLAHAGQDHTGFAVSTITSPHLLC